MRKSVFYFVLLLTAVLLFSACGGEAPTATPASIVTAIAPTAPVPATPVPAATPAAATSAAPTLVTVDAVTTTAKPAPTQASQGNAERGAALFATTCAACHGPKGEGVKGLGKDMTTSKFIAGLSDSDLLAFVKQGRPITDPLNTTGVMMPPKGGNPALTDEQLLDIIAYIRTIHK